MPQLRDPVVTFEVKVNGAALTPQLEIALVHVVVDHRHGVPDLVSLAFHDPERTVLEAPSLKLGNTVTVKARTSDRSTASDLFEGEITALEVEYDSSGMLTVVRGLDRTHRLTYGQRTKTFVNMKYSDIVTQIGSAAGLQVQADATTSVHEHVIQYNQSDLAFINSLAAEIGFDIRVEGPKLLFTKPAPASGAPTPGDLQASSALQLVLGENLRSLRATATTSEQVGAAQVRGWDPKQKRELVASQSRPSPDGATNGIPAGDFTKVNGSVPASAVGTPYQVQAEVDTASRAFAQEVASARIEVEGITHGEPTLRAGTTVSIGQTGRAFDGRYTVTATRHVYEPGEGYRTEFTVSGRADRSLRGLVAGSAPAAAGAHGAVAGVVTAVVTNTNDPENLGRVKVKFPWLDATQESAWARPVQLIAGPSYGALLIPEVNDEVLVAFEQGDPNRPYIVGSLYNGKDKPQKTSADLVKGGKVAQRRIETPTLNRLVFFDHRGTKEGITLRTGDDKFFLDLDKTNTTVVLSSNGDVRIEAKTGTLSITSQQDMVLKSGKNLTLEGTSKTLIKGAQVEVTAQATMKLQASGPLEAKGAIIKLN